MLINDSIIRCRYRNGFEREELMAPGEEVEVTILLPTNVEPLRGGTPDQHRRLVVELPAARAQPNTGEPIGRHTHMVKAEQTVIGGRVVLPVIPAVIDGSPVPGGPVSHGARAADAFPPHDDERPRRIVRLDAVRIARVPVTNAQFHGDGDDRPVTYVSRADAEAFCERAGVRLPTEEEWEAAARGGDDWLWPWGD